MPYETDYSRRGLVKLMLRMPALRGQLQVLGTRNPDFLSLCGAFEEASATLERLRGEHLNYMKSEIAEYENICQELEQEIISMCGR
jgi:hypothetical protein